MAIPTISEKELLSVSKPAQYLGGERGSVVKPEQEVDLRVCLAFPDTYEVGMSHVGMQILYDLINRMPRIWAERAYTPLPDMEQLLRRKAAPLTSLEAKRPLNDFDLIGFSLQYELCMSSILTMLDLAGIPFRASERNESHPLIIGGGPVSYHPEPFADFFDCFLIGDGEELVPEFLEGLLTLKNRGATKAKILDELSEIKGVYVPSFFKPEYDDSGKITQVIPLKERYNGVSRRIVSTLENSPFPTQPLIPNIEAVHDRLSLEVMRGCVRGCRFCQAGYLYRPQRERSPEEIAELVEKALKNSGYEELSLLSLSTADYCSILPLLSVLKERFAEQDRLAISFPSTRVDALTPELLNEVQNIRRSSFTVAPEAGTQRLRDVINKGVTDQQIIDMATNVFSLGWSSIKMYFMIGLPTENEEDLQGIINIAAKVKRIAGKRRSITVSVSTHVPKPDTPFQWAEQIGVEETIQKQEFLRAGLRKLGVNFRYHRAFSSFLEGVFARGDRRLGIVIERAYRLGTRLDGWVEEVKPDLWEQAFRESNLDPYFYLRAREAEEVLPWEHISCDIPKEYFLKEWRRAIATRVTPDCLTQSCSSCGTCDYDATRNVLFDRKRSEGRFNIVDPDWEPIIEARRAGGSTVIEQHGTEAPTRSIQTGSARGYTLREYLKTETPGQVPKSHQKNAAATQRIRVKYSKTGIARFTAHLELATIFFRAARMADIPVAFSRGFNPKPRFAFGPPSQLGLESECEFVDLFLEKYIAPEMVIERLNKVLVVGLKVLTATEVPLKTESIQASISEQRFRAESNDNTSHLPDIENWKDLKIERVRKKGVTTVNLRECVRSISIDQAGFSFVLGYGANGKSLKPVEVVDALTDSNASNYRIVKDGVTFKSRDYSESSLSAGSSALKTAAV